LNYTRSSNNDSGAYCNGAKAALSKIRDSNIPGRTVSVCPHRQGGFGVKYASRHKQQAFQWKFR